MAQKSQINILYNQNIAPEDSEKTSFYYHKILALECLIALFSILSIAIALFEYFQPWQIFNSDKAMNLIMIFSVLIAIAVAFQTFSRIKWMEQKKDIEQNSTYEYIFWGIQTLLLIPLPNKFIYGTLTLYDYSGNLVQMQSNDLLTVYLLGKIIYVFKFLVHSELYYGSRPDRLSRLYTVKFGTFNAIKFLINEKPEYIIISVFLLNFLLLPVMIFLIEGKINSLLSSFPSCIYFVAVTQVTVGYGDINVVTFFGRVFVLLCILIGVTNSSLVLILFIRAMKQTSQEQQSHFLLNSLQKRVNLTKALVHRIQQQWLFLNSHYSPDQKANKQQKIRRFRFNNRRHIMLQRQQPANIKRLMLSNFSNVIQSLTQVKQKQEILSKYIKVIQKAKDTNDEPQSNGRNQKKQIKYRQSLVSKIILH